MTSTSADVIHEMFYGSDNFAANMTRQGRTESERTRWKLLNQHKHRITQPLTTPNSTSTGHRRGIRNLFTVGGQLFLPSISVNSSDAVVHPSPSDKITTTTRSDDEFEGQWHVLIFLCLSFFSPFVVNLCTHITIQLKSLYGHIWLTNNEQKQAMQFRNKRFTGRTLSTARR